MQVMSDLRSMQPMLKIIFITPERLARSDALLRALDTLNQRKLLNRVAIDEAHCKPCAAHPWQLFDHDLRCDMSCPTYLERLSLVKASLKQAGSALHLIWIWLR